MLTTTLSGNPFISLHVLLFIKLIDFNEKIVYDVFNKKGG